MAGTGVVAAGRIGIGRALGASDADGAPSADVSFSVDGESNGRDDTVAGAGETGRACAGAFTDGGTGSNQSRTYGRLATPAMARAAQASNARNQPLAKMLRSEYSYVSGSSSGMKGSCPTVDSTCSVFSDLSPRQTIVQADAMLAQSRRHSND